MSPSKLGLKGEAVGQRSNPTRVEYFLHLPHLTRRPPQPSYDLPNHKLFGVVTPARAGCSIVLMLVLSLRQVVLALSLRRDYWDSVLSQAVMSNYESHLSTQPEGTRSRTETTPPPGDRDDAKNRWRTSLRASNVVMQWDPDHEPFTGRKTAHR